MADGLLNHLMACSTTADGYSVDLACTIFYTLSIYDLTVFLFQSSGSGKIQLEAPNLARGRIYIRIFVNFSSVFELISSYEHL